MRWAAAIATDAHLEDAIGNAADEVLAGLDGARADLVVAFATDHHAGRFARLGDAVARSFPGALVVGCSASGALGGGLEVEHEPAVSLTAAALPGVRLTPLRIGDEPARWDDEIGVPARDDAGDPGGAAGRRDLAGDPAFLLLPCPITCPIEELLEWMDDRWPGAVKVGGGASGGMSAAGPPRNALFLGGDRLAGGAVGVALDGDVHVDTIVAQGCRPIGDPLIVTRARRNVAIELDGEPAVRVLERIGAALSPDDRALARHSLFLGIAMKGGGPLGRGDFVIRNLVGVDPATGGLAAAAPLAAGQIVQLHLRDAHAADADLGEMLAQHDAVAPEGALLFSCVGRGRLLYGVANHDSRAFRRIVGDVPLGGFFCNGEIGPVHRRTFLHGYTSSFALFRRRLPLA